MASRVVAKKNLPPFPVVGVGCSSGGIEALERMFTVMPAESGLAFIVLVHMAPGSGSDLKDVLEKFTKIPVVNARNGSTVKRNTVYMCPPGRIVVFRNGILEVKSVKAVTARTNPVDRLFASIARERKGSAVAIILSGSGNDGTRGMEQVKKGGGYTFAQDPLSAQYDDMPRQAIETGNVDGVAYPADLPALMIKMLSENSLVSESALASNEVHAKEAYEKILQLVYDKTGRDFRLYKYNTILRRIELRMTGRRISTMKEYCAYLEGHPEEVDLLFHDLLIKVTGFFRDGQVFKILESKVVSDICAGKKDGETIRIWSAGCGTGEEAYSCSIIFQNHIKSTGRDLNLLVFASDIDEKALAAARRGLYPVAIAKDLGRNNVDEHFTLMDGYYRVNKDLRDSIVFSVHDLTQDPVFSKIDLILCRNVLIYLRRELQKKVLANLHYALRREGYLVLGYSESLGDFGKLFTVVNKRWKVFCKAGGNILREYFTTITPNGGAAYLPESAGDVPQVKMSDLEGHASRMILSRYAPPWVIVDNDFHVLYFSNNTERYLGHGKGKANLDIIQMASGKLKLELMTALKHVAKENSRYAKDGISVKTRKAIRRVNLVVEPMVYSRKPPLDQRYYLVILEDASVEVPLVPLTEEDQASNEVMKDKVILQLENELVTTRDYLQKAMNDFELSSEELKASNEEVLSMNEELQSANEELQTSKEELQVLNDELTNTNIELHSKVDELTRARNDINNLFSSTDIATVFLDGDMCLKSFTPAAMEIFNFIEKDVGRPVEHFSNKINYASVMDDAREVLRNLAKLEKEIRSPAGRHYMVRIMPYRTDLHTIDGVVLTFTDISVVKKIQTMVKHSEERLRSIFNHTTQSFILVDDNGRVSAANRISEQMSQEIFGRPMQVGDYITQFDFMGGMRQGDLLAYYKSALNDIENEIEVTVINDRGQTVYNRIRFAPVYDDDRQIHGVLVRITDVSERRKYESDLIAAKERAEQSSRIKSQFLANMSHEVRTPLNGIMGLMRLLADTDLDENQKELLDRISISGKILSSLINNILDLSRIESGHREFRRETFQVRELVGDLVKSVSHLAKEKSLSIDFSVSEGIPNFLSGDTLGINQVLINLVNNAIKFTEKGGVKIDVMAKESGESRTEFEFRVIDTGIGIAPEFMEDIFSRFTQIDSSYTKKYAGAGLGLSIVKSLVDLMGGRVSALSEMDRGSEFCVTIPLEIVGHVETSVPFDAVDSQKAAKEEGLNVLLVEDNAINQLALREMLRKKKITVDCAFNGQEALDMHEKTKYDLILMDIQMPVMDGIQCVTAIRQHENEAKRSIPVIALTGYALEQDRLRIMDAGLRRIHN